MNKSRIGRIKTLSYRLRQQLCDAIETASELEKLVPKEEEVITEIKE